jgi:hypothetical protein
LPATLVVWFAGYVRAVQQVWRRSQTIRDKESHPVYQFDLDWDGNGAIYKYPDEHTLWTIRTGPGRPNFMMSPPLRVYDKQDRELIMIRRQRIFPLSPFVLHENGDAVGMIRLRSPLLNRYTIELKEGGFWTFHWLLFSAVCAGNSAEGKRVSVIRHGHTVWSVQIESSADSLRLIAALVFIHRQIMSS